MGRSVIDAVLARPDDPGIEIGGHLPLGLLAPIRYQPHPGLDREQAFVFAGEADGRLLAWRTQNHLVDGGAQTRFVVCALVDREWPDLLDRTISVRAVLAVDRPAVRFSIHRGADSGGTMLIEPSTVRAELSEDQLPEELVPGPEAGLEKPNRPVWLALSRGTVRTAEDPQHADDLQQLEALRPFGPAGTTTTADGTTVEAYGSFTVTTAPNGDQEVRRHKRQLDAEVVVERAAIG